MSENKGIIISGGSINAGQIAVGDNAKAETRINEPQHIKGEDGQNAAISPKLMRLIKMIVAKFSQEELKTLCLGLGVEYDDLPVSGRANKARELVTYLDRRDLIADLIELAGQLRPRTAWHDLLELDDS